MRVPLLRLFFKVATAGVVVSPPAPAPAPSPAPSPAPAPGTAPATPAVPANATVVALAASGDMTDAINNAIAAAPANSCVRFTGTSAHHTYALGNQDGAFPVASNVRLHFDVQLVADDEQNSALYFTGAAGLTVSGLNTGVGTLGPRRGSYFTYKATFVNCSNLALYDPVIRNSAAAGIFLDNCNDFTIARPSVSETLADGIHMTNGSRNGVIYDPQINNPGDDQIAVVSYMQDTAMCDDIIVWRPVTRGQNTSGRGLTVVGGSNIHYYDIDVDSTYGGALCHMCEQNGNFQTQMPVNCSFERGTVKNYNQAASLDHGGYFVLNQLANSKMTDLQCKGITFHDTPNNRPVVNAKDDNISGALMGRILCQDITATGLYYQPSPFNADSAIPTAFNTTLQDNGVTFNNCVAVPSVTAPTIAAQPVSQSVSAGSTATFTVVALANGGTLSYQWWGKAGAISAATSASYTTPITATSDSGSTFYCVVSNSAGSVTSSTVTLTVTRAAVTVPSGATLVTSLSPKDPDMTLYGNDWGSAAGGSPPAPFLYGSTIGTMAGDGFVETIYADTSSSAYFVIKPLTGDHNNTAGKLAFIYLGPDGTVNSGVNANDNVSTALNPGDHVRLRRVGSTFTTEKQIGGAGAWVVMYTFPAAVSGLIRIDLGMSYDGTKRSRSVAALGVTPLPAITSDPAIPAKMSVGMGAIGFSYFSSGLGPVNLALSGQWNNPDGSEGFPGSSIGSDGWPIADFTQIYADIGAVNPNSSTTPTVYNLTFTGSADLALHNLVIAGSTITNSYDAPSNKTTSTVTIPAGGAGQPSQIYFHNTRRTAASAPGTGVTNIDIRRTSDIGKTTKWTDEYKAYITDVGYGAWIRTMDLTQVNGNTSTTDWATRSIAGNDQGTVEMIAALGNETGSTIWFNIPVNATDDYVTHLTQYLVANTTGKWILELGNELWNDGLAGGALKHACVDHACVELHGAWCNGARMITSGSWTGGVLTLGFNFTPDMVVGETLQLNDLSVGGVWSANVASVNISAKTITIPTPTTGSGSVNLSDSNGYFVSSTVSSTLTQNAKVGSSYNVYTLSQRWAMRRMLQISDVVRSAAGDSAMFSKFFPVWADQIGYGPNDAAAEVDYMASISSRTGYGDALSSKLWAIAGAPYWAPDGSGVGGLNLTNHNYSTANTVADYVTAYQQNLANNASANVIEQRVLSAARYGLKSLTYEGGTECYWDTGTNNVNFVAARFDPGYVAAMVALFAQYESLGQYAFNHYHAGTYPVGTPAPLVYGFTDSYTHVSTLWQGFRDFHNRTPSSKRNAVTASGTTVIDCKMWAGNFPSASYYTTDNSLVGFASPGQHPQHRDYTINVDAACTKNLSLMASCNYGSPGMGLNFELNGVIDRATLYIPNSGSLSTFAPVNIGPVTLRAGVNTIRLLATDYHGGSNNETLQSITFS